MAMTHAMRLSGPWAAAACLAAIAVALFHLGRLASAPARRRLFVPAELGHVAVAAAMAVMFGGPPRVVSSLPFAAGCLALAGLLLVVVMVHPACCAPSEWSCCSLLVVEAAAMGCMAGAGRWPVGDLTDWFVVVFAGAALAAVGGPLLRRFRPAWAGVPSITPVASRLVMAGGMLIMLR
ncbi:DUF5134 domain-containing protein [Frankia sp. AgPm24]|nr:DUF5134 domain-containing protein [Frankia sp. AgPm24]MCK9921458.1 DUF5134 domain-containing protein [Frankia sp. AgPm24]